MIQLNAAVLSGSEARLVIALLSHGLMQRGFLKPLAMDLRTWTGLSRQSLYRAIQSIHNSSGGTIHLEYLPREQTYHFWLESVSSKTWPPELAVLVGEILSPSQLQVVRRINSNEKILSVYLYQIQQKKIHNKQAYLFSLLTQDIEVPEEYSTRAGHWFTQVALVAATAEQGRPISDVKKLWDERWKRYMQLPVVIGDLCFSKRFQKEPSAPNNATL